MNEESQKLAQKCTKMNKNEYFFNFFLSKGRGGKGTGGEGRGSRRDGREKQGCALGLDVSVSRRSRDAPLVSSRLVSNIFSNVSVSGAWVSSLVSVSWLIVSVSAYHVSVSTRKKKKIKRQSRSRLNDSQMLTLFISHRVIVTVCFIKHGNCS